MNESTTKEVLNIEVLCLSDPEKGIGEDLNRKMTNVLWKLDKRVQRNLVRCPVSNLMLKAFK